MEKIKIIVILISLIFISGCNGLCLKTDKIEYENKSILSTQFQFMPGFCDFKDDKLPTNPIVIPIFIGNNETERNYTEDNTIPLEEYFNESLVDVII